MPKSALHQFHPAIQNWFNRAFEAPTPPQTLGLPVIARKENVLILAPTGSGKTLAAFLACIDDLLRQLEAGKDPDGVYILYISPLKALNYDIERNLEDPLEGIRKELNLLGGSVPEIRVGVRTGDTSQKERQRMLRQPPHILITTPESLHLLLTSQRARDILRRIQYCIVDEIHALSPDKRGTFLSILLERLRQLARHNFTRIGLSATQKPLERIARFLGGFEREQSESALKFIERPVTIIDAGMRKALDLQVIGSVPDMRDLPDDSIWPSIYRQLFDLVRAHRSTLIFANNRAQVEKITSALNELAADEIALAHHGSVSKEMRREIETKLKRGELPVLVATATLELGIDMGAIDLVCQVESPGTVSTGLQRVGRAGHVYGAASKGRLLPKMRSDLLQTAAITRLMSRGTVAPIKIPVNCLDVLAQQIVAMVAVDNWDLDQLFACIRCAFPYHELPRALFISVIEMLSGRYPAEAFKDLRPRISWDRVNNILYALPGSQRLAIISGGAIPETGQYPVYIDESMVKLGELEEEFVYESRLGDVFQLGTNTWKIKSIEPNLVRVMSAAGQPARLPFWKGEFSALDPETGKEIGAFSRELSEKLDRSDCISWLQQECHLNHDAAWNLRMYFLDQRRKTGSIPTDRHLVIESFKDEMGDLRLAILSPFGARIHFPWRLAILAHIKKQWGVEVESLHSNTGMLFRFTGERPELARDIILQISPGMAEELILDELARSAFFGMRFRHNAGRALLLPRRMPGKRTPLWLLRMRARDLLEIVSQYESFPIVVETYRETLQDWLALDELKKILADIQAHRIQFNFVKTASPSPFCASLLFDFKANYMYDYDQPKPHRGSGAPKIDRQLLDELLQSEKLDQLLSEDAIALVNGRLQGQSEGYRARTPAEFVELLRQIGDLTVAEISERVEVEPDSLLRECRETHRILSIKLTGVPETQRWIAAEEYALYRDAFSQPDNILVPDSLTGEDLKIEQILPSEILAQTHSKAAAQERILTRYIRNHALVTVEEILRRYPVEAHYVESMLSELFEKKALIKIPVSPGSPIQSVRWGFTETIERIRRVALATQRQSIQPCDTSEFVRFLLEWQHVTTSARLNDAGGFFSIIEQLQGYPLPHELWEHDIFARRLSDYRSDWLDQSIASGDILWFGTPAGAGDAGHIVFSFRDDLALFRENLSTEVETDENDEHYQRIKAALKKLGASFITEIAYETGLAPSVCTRLMWEMIWRGEVTNDSFSIVRSGKPSANAAGLEGQGRSQSAYYGKRFRSAPSHRYYPRMNAGRWTALPEDLPKPNLTADALDALVYQMVLRYGMLCRELYRMERFSIAWQDVYQVLVRLEWRGELRRGYFVKGFSGAQFALPEVVDRLMMFRQGGGGDLSASAPLILINACDPANLYGAASLLPLEHPVNAEWRFLRNPGNYLILKQGLPLLAIEARGTRLTPLRPLTIEEKAAIAQKLPELLTGSLKSLKIELWDGQPVRNSEIALYLMQIGFRDEFKKMILERKY
ncbi:DEAD/DEAH box helicase [candidate division KSB1 bacterium]|nr:DEAD/DEAH box helicase [candidate division KSB1 bacterium]